MDNLLKNPLSILAAGAAIGLVLWGLLAGLGLMFALVIKGTIAGFTISPALGTVASYGAVTTGAALSIQLAVRITREAKKEPLTWGAPVLGVLSGFLVQMCEPFWSGPKIMWLVFSVIAGLLVIIGGVLYSQKGRIPKLAGALTSMVVPAAALGATAISQSGALSNFVLVGDFRLWLPLLLLCFVTVVLGVLAHVAAKV